MRHILPICSARVSQPRRAGSTLSEILIALMVMSIGVVSLATLFPVSVLKSIQATQLTNATILRLDVEQLIQQFPGLVLNPDGDNNTGGANPNYLLEHQVAGTRDNTFNTVDNPYSQGGRFIVDPLGWNSPVFNTAFSPAAGTRNIRDEFGNLAGASVDATGDTVLRRYHGGLSSAALANRFGYLPDTWQLAAKGIPTASNTTSITVPINTDLTDLANAITAGIKVRVILFTVNGRQSVIRENLTIAGQVISWTDALPSGTVGRFRVETVDPRYSWLLSVTNPAIDANGNGSANVEVVIFHKRGFKAADEQIYTTNLLAKGTSCTITVPGTTKPFLKKGGFLFDAQHAHWYRITDVTSDANPIVTIDRPASIATTRVMAMPGVVDVYPIGTVHLDLVNNAP